MDEQPAAGDGVRKTILRRRSVRAGFLPDPVPVPVLEEVVRCGLAAPSSKNAQPWRFHVVAGDRTLDRMAAVVETADGVETYVPHDPLTGEPHPGLVSTVLESADILRHAGAAIFVENRGPFSGGRWRLALASEEARAGAMFGYTLELAGIGAAIENMWLAALELGLGGTFMGDVVVAEAWFRERLSLAGDLIGVLALGYGPLSETRPRDHDPRDATLVRWLADGPG